MNKPDKVSMTETKKSSHTSIAGEPINERYGIGMWAAAPLRNILPYLLTVYKPLKSDRSLCTLRPKAPRPG